MKRFWLVLLSLGLIAAFSTSAMAVDVKFSGQFYAAGMYQDKTTFKKDTASDGPSTAFYFQRLRIQTDFVVSPGLTLTTRADIMERSWGAARSNVPLVTTNDSLSAGTRAENENIVFDLAYVTYASPIGIFSAGYQIESAWGTVFHDNGAPAGKITYTYINGGLIAGLQVGKAAEYSRRTTSYSSDPASLANANAADRDSDFYTAFALYGFKGGEVGFLYQYFRAAGGRSTIAPDAGSTMQMHFLIPYAKFRLGPIAIQAELDYAFGQIAKWDGALPNGGLADTRLDNIAGWIDATADFGTFYFGGSMAYVAGDDPGTGQVEGGIYNGGRDWNPCLLMFNSDRSYWAGDILGYGAASNSGPMSNAWFFQARAGVRPIDKLDIMASVSYANADKKPTTAWLYNDYGWEVDLTATYKITNNLSYMLGGAYMFTGKYYQADQQLGANLSNNYLIINKLTLTF